MFDIIAFWDEAWEQVEEKYWTLHGLACKAGTIFKKKSKKLKQLGKTGIALGITMLITMIVSIIFTNTTLLFLSSLGSVAMIVVTYFMSASLKEFLLLIAKMIPDSKDKKVAKEKEDALKKLETTMVKFVNTLNYAAMAIATTALLIIVFGFGSISWNSAMIVTLLITIFCCVGFFAKKEILWPKNVVIGLAIFSAVFWFKSLDNEVSRSIASWMNVFQIKTAENTDARNGAIAKANATLYAIDSSGNLSESSENDTILKFSQFVRFTSKQGETKRFDDELFTKIIIPNKLGSYARGKRYWIQSSFLERGVKFFPNANAPEYAIKESKNILGRKVLEVYFLTNKTITLENLQLGMFSFGGVQSGELLVNDVTDPQGTMVPAAIGIKLKNKNKTRTMQCTKGRMITITPES